MFRLDDPSVLTVDDFRYTNPGPDAFFWAGEEGGCDPASIDNKSYNLAPGRVGSRATIDNVSFMSDYYSIPQLSVIVLSLTI